MLGRWTAWPLLACASATPGLGPVDGARAPADAGSLAEGEGEPWPTDPDGDPPCLADVQFRPIQPELQCAWTEANVTTVPVVARLDDDDIPEIVVVGDYNSGFGSLYAIHGDTCETAWSAPTDGWSYVQSGTDPAVGDLDGDGRPEIAVVAPTDRCFYGIRVYNHDGSMLVEGEDWPLCIRGEGDHAGAITIANLDGVGVPEIVYGGYVFRYEKGSLRLVWERGIYGAGRGGPISAVADVDRDGSAEVVLGHRIYDGPTGADETPTAMRELEGGYPAIADFDRSTPEPEVAVAGHGVSLSPPPQGEVRIQTIEGVVLFGPFEICNGGPPTVADLDSDGEPELAVASCGAYTVFDTECLGMPLPAACQGPGIRWSKLLPNPTEGVKGSSAFDLNGDGAVELAYAGACWFRIYDGATGETVFATTSTGDGGYPVIADVDGDGATEIVVVGFGGEGYRDLCPAEEPELGVPFTGPTPGVYVYRDVKDAWVASRPVWNQHAYHVTNVNDDGTIPVVEPNSWETWNAYRAPRFHRCPTAIPK